MENSTYISSSENLQLFFPSQGAPRIKRTCKCTHLLRKEVQVIGGYYVLEEKPSFIPLKSLFSSSFLWRGCKFCAAFSILNSRVKNSVMLSQVHSPTIAFSLCLRHVADVLRSGRSSNLPQCSSSTPPT